MDKYRLGDLWAEDEAAQILCSRHMEPLKPFEADYPSSNYPSSSGKEGMKKLPRKQSWMADRTQGVRADKG